MERSSPLETQSIGIGWLIPAWIAVIVIAAVLLVKIVLDLRGFMSDLKYINREIRRTGGEELKHWKREKRRLILSMFFPFIHY